MPGLSPLPNGRPQGRPPQSGSGTKTPPVQPGRVCKHCGKAVVLHPSDHAALVHVESMSRYCGNWQTAAAGLPVYSLPHACALEPTKEPIFSLWKECFFHAILYAAGFLGGFLTAYAYLGKL